MTEHAEKARRFLALHRGERPLLLPNPWDQGSAKLLASLGFQALATTSSGHAAERVAAAAEIAHGGPMHLVLTARAENYLHGRPDLDDTISRLQAYQAAGADVLYAPGLSRPGGHPRPRRFGGPPCQRPGSTRGSGGVGARGRRREPGVGRRRVRLRRPGGRDRGGT